MSVARKMAEGHALIAAGHQKIAEALLEDEAPEAEPSKPRRKMDVAANHSEPRHAQPLTVQEIADARMRARRRGLLRTP